MIYPLELASEMSAFLGLLGERVEGAMEALMLFPPTALERAMRMKEVLLRAMNEEYSWLRALSQWGSRSTISLCLRHDRQKRTHRDEPTVRSQF
jgi:hypothetical protein